MRYHTKTLLTATGLFLALAFTQAPAQAEEVKIEGTLTAPSGGNPFGGSPVGSYSVKVENGHEVKIKADFDTEPAAGFVLEGWLVDVATGYKLSLGQLEETALKLKQTQVNPFTYNVLVITLEPYNDTDPNPAVPVGGDLLATPFGQ
jgi:hypothetical protein